jgi:uncharacterized protein (TIGR02118 family)
MIKASALYPYEEGKRFDLDYYLNRHLPLARELWGSACKGMEVDEGIRAGEPGSKPLYIVMFHVYFDSEEAYLAALLPHMDTLVADIPNYTDIQPIIQVSEVKM